MKCIFFFYCLGFLINFSFIIFPHECPISICPSLQLLVKSCSNKIGRRMIQVSGESYMCWVVLEGK